MTTGIIDVRKQSPADEDGLVTYILHIEREDGLWAHGEFNIKGHDQVENLENALVQALQKVVNNMPKRKL